MSKRTWKNRIAGLLAAAMLTTFIPFSSIGVQAADIPSGGTVVTPTSDGYNMTNDKFDVDIGKYGQIKSLKIVDDKYPTNYVLNEENAPDLADQDNQWMGEVLFQTKTGDAQDWTEAMTSVSTSRKVSLDGNKVVVTYKGKDETASKGIKDFDLVETYELVDNKLHWSMKVTNTNENELIFGDFGIPMPFNQKWNNTIGEAYEQRCIYHSFVGQDSSYIYASRPSGQGQFLLFTPDALTGAKLEYRDRWMSDLHGGTNWVASDGWADGLNVFYIHSNVIKKTGMGYLTNTQLTLKPGESKEYSFNFEGVDGEKNMGTALYNDGIIDAVAVPGMAFPVNVPAKFYLHTKLPADKINCEVNCTHETHLYEDLKSKSASVKQACTKDKGTSVKYLETKTIDGEQYHIYELKLSCLGPNNVVVTYGDDNKKTTLQFYSMDSNKDALALHANFVADKTQVNAPGTKQDKIFDDWMLDTKSVRGQYNGYFGWGDDWGFTHGEYLAAKNIYEPVASQIKQVDDYLDIGIWNGLMKEHHEDYLVNDWLDDEPNKTGQGTNRGYAYAHVYNSYFSMYKIAEKYPDVIKFKESKNTYLLRAYNIMKALYDNNIAYSWGIGLMGEQTTPEIIDALEKEGYYVEAQYIRDIMTKKYDSFKGQKYPYGSEYPYDNTGEEAVYTLANMNDNKEWLSNINLKTRACRGTQPIWYYYGNPTTICGDNWWQFQYSVALAGYCMDDWLRNQDNDMTSTDSAIAARVNYAAKLGALTCINSGQIDADPANIGAVSWSYQAEMGNNGGEGTGSGNIHNGWRQMAGEADTGLFGALRILSSDVAIDPVFGLFGYGCNVAENAGVYTVQPLDGVNARLNFISEKLYVELDRDQYTQANVKKDKTYVDLSVKNLEKTTHDTDIKLTGLKAGTYIVSVDGVVTGCFTAVDGKAVTVTAPLAANDSAEVIIEQGTLLDNKTPSVEAGSDKTIQISDSFRLEGTAKDDGLPDMNLTYSWEVTKSPEGSKPVIKNSDKLISDVVFDKTGSYEFKLTVSDGKLATSDTVTVTVTGDAPVPETLANYTFDKIDVVDKIVYDETGKGYNASMISYPKFVEAKSGNGISLSGSYCGYVKLPADVTKRVKDATISVDFKLNGDQKNGARLFEFGDMNNRSLSVSFLSENELALNIMSGSTVTAKTGMNVAPGYWKNASVTIKDNKAILYVDGVEKAKIENCNFSFADLGKVQRNFIGRSYDMSAPFLNGVVDNFNMKSVAMTSDDVKSAYGLKEEPKIVSAGVSTVATTVGIAPILPSEVKILYTDGIYRSGNITWDEIPTDKYNSAGTFDATGVIKDTTIPVHIKVIVTKGTIKNVGLLAVPSAIFENVKDPKISVNKINDGYDPTSSRDQSHGFWHNWDGDQKGTAWVQYTWNNKIVLSGCDAYYFTDGNFVPSSVEIQYLDESNTWKTVSNPKGLGNEIDKYNYTSFDPVETTALRMVMTPKTVGIGVIEWKAYGYSDGSVIDYKALDSAINIASNLNKGCFVSSLDAVQAALADAKSVRADKNATKDVVDSAADRLNNEIKALEAKDGNLAYTAEVSTSFVSGWEKLTAVNDGQVSKKSDAAGINAHYGTWGNTSDFETVTYTWPDDVNITGSAIMIWNDGGGIHTPKACKYEYKDKNGNWVEIPDAQGLGVELDKFNVTTFNPISTNSLRLTLVKNNKLSDKDEDPNHFEPGDGVGLIEWKVNGNYVEAAAKPVATPGEGTYTQVQNVTLSTTTTGASIYFTLDGTTPTTASAIYISPITVSTSETIKAIAVKAGMVDSDVATFCFTINNNNSSSDTGSDRQSTTQNQTQNQTSIITVTPDGKVKVKNTQKVQDGTIVGEVPKSDIDSAFDKAKADANGIKTIVIELEKRDKINRYSQKLASSIVSSDKGDKNIQIITPVANITVPSNMIKKDDAKGSSNVEVVVESISKTNLSPDVQKQIGDRPVINLYVTIDGKKIVWNNPATTVTVEIDYTPTAKELENLDKIVVYYIDANNKLVPVPSGRYDAKTGKVTFKTTHFSNYAIAYIDKTFADSAKYAWSQKAIEALTAKGIADGRTETAFSPEKLITREECLAWLVRILGLTADAKDNFTDVSNSKYAKDIAIAKALGITGGVGNNKFNPGKEITRQELMTLTVKALDVAKKSLEKGTKDDIKKFKDASKVSTYALESVATLVKSGIIAGSDSNINPKGNTTRAEAAVIMYKLYNR